MNRLFGQNRKLSPWSPSSAVSSKVCLSLSITQGHPLARHWSPPHQVTVNTTEACCCWRDVNKDRTLIIQHFSGNSLSVEQSDQGRGRGSNTRVIPYCVPSWDASVCSPGAHLRSYCEVRSNNSCKVLNTGIAHSKFSISISFSNKLTFLLSKVNAICPVSSFCEFYDL